MRADARRNRDRIVEAARAVVAERGIDAPMELIARRAEVGVGTVYRRFPDRHALIAAMAGQYVHEIDDALTRAEAQEPGPWAAVRSFVMWSADQGRGALAAALADLPQELFDAMPEFTRVKSGMVGRLDALVAAAQERGDMRADVGVADVMRLLSLFTCHADLPQERAAHYLLVMLDGMEKRPDGAGKRPDGAGDGLGGAQEKGGARS
ncbi:TetR/AcrR family transcriptional regulator [Nonomuraea dietziae]|uniref:TetR/AcrR family transcriptional regulator n=1 Tax=Nonomuraea dietziae TaxID=65515 RepID=UPI0033F3ED5B